MIIFHTPYFFYQFFFLSMQISLPNFAFFTTESPELFIKQFSRHDLKCKRAHKTILVIFLLSGAHTQNNNKKLKNWSPLKVYIWGHLTPNLSIHEPTFVAGNSYKLWYSNYINKATFFKTKFTLFDWDTQCRSNSESLWHMNLKISA